MSGIDVAISLQGTIVLFHLFLVRAEQWVSQHVDSEAQWLGGALVVEHRYATNLVHKMCGAGLLVQLTRVGVA